MSDEKRSYRKPLTSQGVIYLLNQELEISVRNLSITGLLAELEEDSFINGIEDVFHGLELSPTIDLYLPEMRLAGEVDVVRVDKIAGRIYLALEFRNLSYNVDNLLYKRKAYRKLLNASGHIVINEDPYLFLTQNVSVEGLMVHFKEKVIVEPGVVASFDFPRLNLKGDVKVIWVDYEDNGYTLMGLQYERLLKDHIQGIPGFLS